MEMASLAYPSRQLDSFDHTRMAVGFARMRVVEVIGDNKVTIWTEGENGVTVTKLAVIKAR